jgi:predicted AlkP superfamily phosphohydrolase/phosphomutase
MFDGVDKLQHLCWRFLDAAYVSGAPTPWESEIVGLCEEYFRRLDTMIGRVVDLAGPGATILLGSDHGFGPTEDIFYVNSWLEQEGYLVWADDQQAAPGDVPMVGFGQMTRHVYQLDWSRTRAYAATPSSQAIHIVTHPHNAAPLSREEYLSIRDDIVAKLGELRSPRTGNPFVIKAWTKDEAFSGPFDALAPDITLTLDEGAAVSILRSNEIVARRAIPLGNHRWDGIFVAAGPTIRQGERVDEVSLLDLAPTILYSLGVPIPDDVSGRLPESIFKTGVLMEHPPVYVDVASRVQSVADIDAGIDEEAETTILKRLRALGYVE